MTAATGEEESTHERAAGFGSLGFVVGMLFAAWAAALASRPLNDNSFFTHLATGRLILDDGRVPTSDPYTFTAAGERWTVQSWLASVAYAGFERLAGTLGLRLLLVTVYVVAALLLWWLSRPAPSLLVRLGLVAGVMLVASSLWTERPYMVGVIGVALVLLALDDRIPWWTLLPAMWVWGNSHGSFVLAPGLVLLVLAGGALDRGRHRWREIPRAERMAGLAVLAGCALAAVGPLGLRAVTFPLVAARRSDVFRHVTEWQAPTFRSPSELAYLAFAITCLVLIARHAPRWRVLLPSAAFVAASLYAQRNIVLACVVLVAAVAPSTPPVGALRSTDRPPLTRPVAAVVAFLAVAVGLSTLVTPANAFDDYAQRPIAWLEQSSYADLRMATDLVNGNMLEVIDGASGEVFVDDRFDVLPDEVFRDYLELMRGGSRWHTILGDLDVEVVVWSRREALATLLATSPQWRIVFSDPGWVLAVRRS